MRKGYKKLSVLFPVIIVLCLLVSVFAIADTSGGENEFESSGELTTQYESSTDPNNVPVVFDKSYNTNEDTSLIVAASEGVLIDALDVNGGTLTADVVLTTTNGDLNLETDGAFTYQPDPGFFGTDTFTFVANEGELVSESATVTINVLHANTEPSVNDQYYITAKGTVLTKDSVEGVLKGATDADDDALTAGLVAGPWNGSVTLNADGSFTYTPDENFVGEDCFEFSVTDAIATVSAFAYIKVGVPDVKIEKTVDKPNAYAGDSVKYSITITNIGDTKLGDIIVYDNLMNKSWMLENLEPSLSSVITYDYLIPANMQVNDTITNTATVYANEYNNYAYRILSEETQSNILYEPEGNQATDNGNEYDLVESFSANVTIIQRQQTTYSSSTTYTLLMAITGEGTVSPGAGTRYYSEGSTVQLSATPAEGWKFDGWQGDAVNESNQIRMNGNKSVTAVFSLIEVEEEVVEDEIVPQAPVNEIQDDAIVEEEVPAAPVEELPKTGGIPAVVLYGLGTLIAAAGFMLNKKTKE